MARATKYTVRAGDDWQSIARKYGLDATSLIQANKSVYETRPGTVINLPTERAFAQPTYGGGATYPESAIPETPMPKTGVGKVLRSPLPAELPPDLPDYRYVTIQQRLENGEDLPASLPFSIFKEWADGKNITTQLPQMITDMGYTLVGNTLIKSGSEYETATIEAVEGGTGGKFSMDFQGIRNLEANLKTDKVAGKLIQSGDYIVRRDNLGRIVQITQASGIDRATRKAMGYVPEVSEKYTKSSSTTKAASTTTVTKGK